MDDHVVSPLHKGGLNGADRAEVAGGNPGGEQRGMLFGDTNVMILGGQFSLQLIEACARRHRRGDADDATIGLSLTQ